MTTRARTAVLASIAAASASCMIMLAAAAAPVADAATTTSSAAKNAMKPPRVPRQKRSSMPYLKESDLEALMGKDYDPKLAAQNWKSVNEDVEFLPLMRKPNNNKDGNNNNNNNNKAKEGGDFEGQPKPRRNLAEEDYDNANDATTTTSGAYANYDPFSVQPFVEGMSEYDEYQQAWRLLGFMIDCNTVMYDDDQYSSGGSGDEITEEGCARYVIWAAYVDLEYEGGGIGEYQYYNKTGGNWDTTSCEYAEAGSGGSNNSGDGNGDDDDDEFESRCAKMDCHLEDTHFSVLGFFKHRNYDDWMEQLFKHEGMCVWSDEEYAFMKNARKAWPKGCADSGATISAGQDENGNTYGNSGNEDDDYISSSTSPLYYNIKPLRNGRIAVGLYTDAQCITEYPSSTDYVESILGNVFLDAGSQHSGDNDDAVTYDFSSDTLSESMDRWDSAFDVWHYCHPCIAHDLENTGGNKYTDDDDGYGDYYYYNGQYYYYGDGGRRTNERKVPKRKLGGEYAAEGDVFECYDDAGYTNVNQCMKFSAKTVMKTATFRDLSLGRHQGSLVEYPLSGYFDARSQYRAKTMKNVGTYFFLVSAASLLVLSLFNLYKVAKQTKRGNIGSATTSDGLLT